MAARTYYDLTILHPDADKILDDFIESNEEARMALNGDRDPQNWYSDVEDLKEFSKKYPDASFIMDCESENGGDQQYRIYAKNGKGYWDGVILSFPDFDESKMIE
jgi:hypothetical protein